MAEDLKSAFFSNDSENTYAVVDGAACEELLDKLAEFHPEYVCLYAGEVEPDVQEVAPYLVKLPADHLFTDWFLANAEGNPWGIFARTPAGLRALRKHFRQFLLVKGPGSEMLAFRFYDPRVLSAFLPIATPEQLDILFGPVVSFACETDTFRSYRWKDRQLAVSE